MLHRSSLLPALALVFAAAACSDADEGARDERFALGDAPYADDEGPARPPLELPPDAPRVAFLGDSIAAGLHLPADRAFPAVLQRRLYDAGLPFELVNAGVSGDTTAGGLSRVDWVLSQEPAVLVVELGANDGLRGVALESIETNLEGIVTKAEERGVPVLLLGVRIPPSLGHEYSEEFADVYERLAERHELAFVPFFMRGVGGVAERMLPDGLHPTAEGHEVLADNVEAALEQLLRSRVAASE